MRRYIRLGILFTLAAMLAMPSAAFLFGGKEDESDDMQQPGPRVRYKYHLHIPDRNTEQELEELLTTRRLLEEDVGVLDRLRDKKTKEYAVFQERLEEEFGIVPNHYYAFDNESLTIYDVTQGEDRRELHKQLVDQQQVDRFLALSSEKKERLDAVRLLKKLLDEQSARLDQVNRVLGAKFNLQPRTGYYYDRNKMILYEVVPAGRGR